MKATSGSKTLEEYLRDAINDCMSVYCDITPQDIRIGLVSVMEDYL